MSDDEQTARIKAERAEAEAIVLLRAAGYTVLPPPGPRNLRRDCGHYAHEPSELDGPCEDCIQFRREFVGHLAGHKKS